MILNVHSDASYLSAKDARSHAAGYYFLGSLPRDNEPIHLNGAIHVISRILRLVAASSAEAELSALFMNAKETKIIRLNLHQLGHPQPPTPIHVDNSTAVGIVTNTMKRNKSRSIEMRYFWLLDGSTQKLFNFKYHPWYENLADYPSKSHTGTHHLAVRPFYIHMPTSPHFLHCAAKLSVWQVCVNKLGPTYITKPSRPYLKYVNRTFPLKPKSIPELVIPDMAQKWDSFYKLCHTNLEHKQSS
jgi:hypothetical protein